MVLALLVGSAFLHAAWNAGLKWTRHRHHALSVVIGTAVLASSAVALSVTGWDLGPSSALPYALLSGVGESLYIMALARVYDTMPLGVGYLQLRAFAMVLTWALSVGFLAEPWTPWAAICVAAILLGMWLTEGAKRHWVLPNGWVLAAAAGVTTYHLGYGQALRLGADPASVIAFSLALALPGQMLARPRAVRGMRLKLPEFALSVGLGLLCAASFLGFLYGLRQTHAGVGISVRNSSIAFAQGFAWLAGERLSHVQVLGMLAVLAGVLALGMV